MSAPDKREVLEAVIHRELTRAWKYGLEPGRGDQRPRPARVILDAVDAYAAAAPQPPHWAGLTAEPLCDATDKPDHAEDGYLCTSQAGHAPPHLAHDADGRIMHAWEAS